jgi:hypothetical protein
MSRDEVMYDPRSGRQLGVAVSLTMSRTSASSTSSPTRCTAAAALGLVSLSRQPASRQGTEDFALGRWKGRVCPWHVGVLEERFSRVLGRLPVLVLPLQRDRWSMQSANSTVSIMSNNVDFRQVVIPYAFKLMSQSGGHGRRLGTKIDAYRRRYSCELQRRNALPVALAL